MEKPPLPPFGTPITLSLDRETLRVQKGFSKWQTPAAGALIQTHDATGQRITVTRAVTIGLFALGAKKRTGHVTVVITGRDQQQWTMLKIPAKKAEKILDWAFRWNIWSELAAQAPPQPMYPAPPYMPPPSQAVPPPQPYTHLPQYPPPPYPPRPPGN